MMAGSPREVCGSERRREKNPKSMWWNDVVKAAVERKEAVWKKVFEARDEVTKEGYM